MSDGLGFSEDRRAVDGGAVLRRRSVSDWIHQKGNGDGVGELGREGDAEREGGICGSHNRHVIR
ncbi:unnamed protein product [Prunus armeniaca]|uniref:Uncharacterized protein n=1 Tax=Prunus armeniaca TaxID=36596 RepID=A0A6J5W4D7_PRUAR|nr:unnamed protein product [Prunus armeniaca]CAB4294695.1 unnamed protein product [Prunus armeniaca]